MEKHTLSRSFLAALLFAAWPPAGRAVPSDCRFFPLSETSGETFWPAAADYAGELPAWQATEDYDGETPAWQATKDYDGETPASQATEDYAGEMPVGQTAGEYPEGIPPWQTTGEYPGEIPARQAAAEQPDDVSASSAARSPYALYDTLQVLHNTIRLDLSAIGEATLRGRAEITLHSKQDNLTFAPFLLLGMQIDSVQVNGRPARGYQYNDTLLRVPLGVPLQQGEEARVAVVYHGRPVRARFGGFTFTDSLRHAHNMGVWIDGSPHSFGRSWFPAVDDFRSRSTFDLYLRADTALKAIGSGVLQNIQPASGGTAVWHWHLGQPIPDYLVSVAVGPYEQISYPYTSVDGRPLPVDVYVFPDEAEAARETYAILPRTLRLLENYFGPYAFDRVGYVSVDRRGGAMEHVANISMPRHPRPTVDYHTLVIHELIHSWFGNRVTCRTAADMWLNEGITNFGPELVLEKLYGPEEAARYVRQNQWVALLMAPRMEKAYLSLADVPEEHTYGATVYDKGAMVMHTLRHYLGDEKLLPALKAYVEAYAFRTASVADFQSFIARHTATDLTDFFDLWVNRPGFVTFEIDSIRGRDVAGGFEGTVYLEQKRCHAPEYGRNVRVPLTFYDAGGHRREMREVVVSGRHAAVPLHLPFRPAFGLVDPGYALCKASLYEAYRTDTAGVYTSRLCRLAVEAEAVAPCVPESASSSASEEAPSSAARAFPPASLHLEYYRVTPDPIRGEEARTEYLLCDTHYWRVSGSVPGAVRLTGRFPVATEGPEAAWLEGGAAAGSDVAGRNRDVAAGDGAGREKGAGAGNDTPGNIWLMYRRDASDDWKPVARIPRAEPSAEAGAEEAARPKKGRPAAEREIVAPLLPGEYCLGTDK